MIRAAMLLFCGPLIGAGALAAQPVVCSTTGISDLAFGVVDPQSSQPTQTTATISFSCSNPNNQTYHGAVCFRIVDGVTGPRDMQDGNGHSLPFQVYTDAGHSVIWGMGAANSVNVQGVSIPAQSSALGSATLYGQIPPGQSSAVAGSYQYLFAGTQTTIAVNLVQVNKGAPPDCTGIAGTSTGQSFHAIALVDKKCTVQASLLDFGTPAGLLVSNIDGATTTTTQCTAGTPYQIGLDNGLYPAGTTRRMSGGSSDFITYELFLDSNRTQRWGNTLNIDTLNQTGTGQSQASTIFGRVAAQPTPSPGSYSDTVTVTVTY
jgi:spore coat protein U-like protein